MSRKIPSNASVVHQQEDQKLFAPSAERNVSALTDFLVQQAPASGTALELASGTGQHISAFAAAMPDLTWQPTEIEDARRASINAYVAEAKLGNVAAARHLNATQSGWSKTLDPVDMVMLINLLHLISSEEAQTLLKESAAVLKPGGFCLFYGPFSRDGTLISDGDQRFDAQLRAANPAIGYKDTLDMARWLGQAGLVLDPYYEMPANNLALIARKSQS